MTVYGAQGRLVKSLAVNESMTAGQHAVVWNGTDAAGNNAASGAYIYRLLPLAQGRAQPNNLICSIEQPTGNTS